MMGGRLRRFLAGAILLLYISMLAVGSVVSLTCDCQHHHADVHTSFNHVHVCCHDCHDAHSELQYADSKCCNHNHSNDVEFYIPSRSGDDDTLLRHAMALAIVSQELSYGGADEVVGLDEYRQLVLPILADGYVQCSSLRAPPALV